MLYAPVKIFNLYQDDQLQSGRGNGGTEIWQTLTLDSVQTGIEPRNVRCIVCYLQASALAYTATDVPVW